MQNTEIAMNPNKLVQQIGKLPDEFTKADIIKFIENNHIEIVNFRYVGGDRKLKTLNFSITSKTQLDRLLSAGERVDGSSLFSYIDTASSDLYVVPRYKTAFVNPFSTIPALDIFCAYYTKEGEKLPIAPGTILTNAHKALTDVTGLSLEAMGELEYYIICDEPNSLYPGMVQKGYHDSSPFCKWEHLRIEAMKAIVQAGGKIKYSHSEVGHIAEGGQSMEQHEIEFMPVSLEDAADQMVLAKWILRMIGYQYGVTISFAPKIVVGHAGSGLHVHTKLAKEGRNMTVDNKGQLSENAKRVIAGYLTMAPSLTAFGNTVPTSYLRLVPHQEAPTNICWGDRNRSVLVRVPLGWAGVDSMFADVNPREKKVESGPSESRQTIEFRCPDGSADIYLLLAGLAVAARHGLEMKDALDIADKLYVDVNIFSPKHSEIQDKLTHLPTSCWESADHLLKDRALYEKDNVFPAGVIDGIAKSLQSFSDKDLSERLSGKNAETAKLVKEHLHCS